MRVHVLHHAACFDGAASSAVFAAFYREHVAPDATLVFLPKQHRQGDPFGDADFDADDSAVVDFRYSARARLGWFFDHHASAFQLPGERAHFDADETRRKFHDPAAPSCAGFVAKVLGERWGFDAGVHAELLRFAELVDTAAFADPSVPVALEQPALRLMTFAEQNREPALVGRFIEDLATVPFVHLANAAYINAVLDPVLARHQRDIALFAQRCRPLDDVLEYELLDQPPRAYNKFIPYFHHPAIRYVVGLSVGPDGMIRLTVGYNPWLPRDAREHDISRLCEHWGGGGHPYVGGATFTREAEARAAQRWIATVLRGGTP